MNAFAYDKNGDMLAEGVALETIARQVGTPFYCYSAAPCAPAGRSSPTA
jgi:diaminopimelate decarboxylase